MLEITENNAMNVVRLLKNILEPSKARSKVIKFYTQCYTKASINKAEINHYVYTRYAKGTKKYVNTIRRPHKKRKQKNY